jgi:hypothetical protein
VVPSGVRGLFGDRKRFGDLLTLLKRSRRLAELVELPAGARLQKDRQAVAEALDKVKRSVRCRRLYTLCPACVRAGDPDGRPSCKSCRGSGWVDELRFKAAPAEMRAAVEALADPDADTDQDAADLAAWLPS